MSASIAPGSGRSAYGLVPAVQTMPADFAWRVLRLLNVSRFFVALVLLVIFYLVRDPRVVGEFEPGLAGMALVALLAISTVNQMLLARRFSGILFQVYLQHGVDLVALILLLHASGGVASGLGGLLVVSTGTLALLVPLDRALLLAAMTTFALLGEQTLSFLRGFTSNGDFAATGILAAVVFIITAVVQVLRDRMVATEALAEQRGVDLQNLVELNDYIIQHLRESIVVVDSDNRIRLLNESAAKLLGSAEDSRGTELKTLAPQLATRLARWRAGVDLGSDTTLVLDSDQSATTLHPQFARLGNERDEGVVIFLEDSSLILDRVQQTKLAALGRLSASIAHEIRNPLGALSHAGQLLEESENLGPDDRRLTDIIKVNSQRVSHIVDSVLTLSRRDRTKPEQIQLRLWAQDFTEEFCKTQELYEGALVVRDDSIDIDIEMDRTHLHQVLWNLCENAVKYASATAGAIAVEIQCGIMDNSNRAYIDVIDSGPGIDAELVDQIFEPFYTAQPGGTGLGLYISRELCERNGANLRYYPRHSGGSVFRIIFADPKRWQTENRT